jgi:uroporphyrinogen III methyltransferase / synthase
MTTAGRVVFIGGGTGDPRLVTLRGAEALGEADAVVLPPGLDLRELVKAGAAVVEASRVAPEELIARARGGEVVARVVFGDALAFGADDEALAVARAGIDVEIVPGIPLAIVAGAYAGLSLTRAADPSPSVALARVGEGMEALHSWEKLGTATDVLAIAARGATVAEIARSLVYAGRSPATLAAFAEGLGTPRQRVVTAPLDAIGREVASLGEGLLVVGEVVLARRELAWLEKRPLFGRRVLVTRTREQSRGTARLLRARGADPVIAPAIEIGPPREPGLLAAAVAQLGEAQCVVFTSANGVERTWGEIAQQGRDARAFGGAKLAAIGPGTAAALEAHGLRADIVAKEHKQEGLAEEILAAFAGSGSKADKVRVVLLRAEVARDVLPNVLRAAGFHVDVVAAYETRPPEAARAGALARELETGALDAVTFTSSSTVDNLCDLLGPRAAELLSKTCVASIGPVTSKTCVARGVRVDATATSYTIPGLIEALEGHFSRGAR